MRGTKLTPPDYKEIPHAMLQFFTLSSEELTGKDSKIFYSCLE